MVLLRRGSTGRGLACAKELESEGCMWASRDGRCFAAWLESQLGGSRRTWGAPTLNSNADGSEVNPLIPCLGPEGWQAMCSTWHKNCGNCRCVVIPILRANLLCAVSSRAIQRIASVGHWSQMWRTNGRSRNNAGRAEQTVLGARSMDGGGHGVLRIQDLARRLVWLSKAD